MVKRTVNWPRPQTVWDETITENERINNNNSNNRSSVIWLRRASERERDDMNKLCKLSQINEILYTFPSWFQQAAYWSFISIKVIELCKKKKIRCKLCEFVRWKCMCCVYVRCILAMRKNGTRNCVTHSCNLWCDSKVNDNWSTQLKIFDFNSCVFDHITIRFFETNAQHNFTVDRLTFVYDTCKSSSWSLRLMRTRNSHNSISLELELAASIPPSKNYSIFMQ